MAADKGGVFMSSPEMSGEHAGRLPPPVAGQAWQWQLARDLWLETGRKPTLLQHLSR